MITAQLPFLAGTVLLAIAGAAKLRHPTGTVAALRGQGLPAGAALVRVLGTAEILVAGAAVAGFRPAAWGVALLYVGFTAFVLLALHRAAQTDRPLVSCGCFGEPDLPPTRTHAVLTSVVAIAAALAATGPVGRGWFATLSPLETTAALLGVALIVTLAHLTLTGLPRLAAARHQIENRRHA